MALPETLRKIGLTEGEIQVYTALLDLGGSSTGKITKKANISSSKVYEVLQRLLNKGLVSFVINQGVKYYKATPPERLIDFLEDKKEELSRGQNEIKKLIPLINLKNKQQQKETEALIYRGRQGPKIVLKEILEAGKKMEKNYGFGTNDDDYVKYFPAQLNDFIKESRKFKIKSKLIFANGFKSPNTTARIKYLPPEFFFPVRTMIYGSTVAIVDFTEPMTTIIIEKEEIAQAYKNHFILLWKIAKSETKNGSTK